MVLWKDIILYTFVCYVIVHLLIDDILLIIRFTRAHNNQMPDNQIEVEEQRTLIKICFKVCDVVRDCVLKYLDIFTICWNKSVDCLQITMCKYIDFLDSLCKVMLAYPTCVVTCSAGVIVVGLACVMVWILFSQT